MRTGIEGNSGPFGLVTIAGVIATFTVGVGLMGLITRHAPAILEGHGTLMAVVLFLLMIITVAMALRYHMGRT